MSAEKGPVIAVVGGGEIGLGMATVFADAGACVSIADPDMDVRKSMPERARAYRIEMAEAGLLQDCPGGRIDVAAVLEDLPARVDLAIEAGPEDLGVKRSIFSALHTQPGEACPLVTTSSAITVSEIVEAPVARKNCLVAHPANPPTLIRVVECVPAPETDPAVAARVAELLSWAGFAPVSLAREIEGFALNRLQSALLREAYRLVEAGVIDVAGVDRLVSEGLGPRWALSGPFETADLNTPGGILGHARRMGPAYARIGKENGGSGLPWSDALIAEVARQRRAALPETALPARVTWRRRALARLLKTRSDGLAFWEADGPGHG
ncbi:MAG: 3-hydroxyacyl-CoA dehydrogenase NAD-binding domain-containing protein [Geminicoccaceae bacterium]